MENKNDLIRKINELDEKYEQNKLKRSLITIALYSVANMFIAYLVCKGQDISFDINIIVDIVIVSVIFAVVSFVVNAAVFGYLFNRSQAERSTLEYLNKKLEELDK